MWNERMRALRPLLAGVAVIWAAPAMAAPVFDATWSTTPGSGDFNTATNWNPPAINPPSNAPNGTAFFGTSSITSLSLSVNTRLGGFTFNPGAPAYSFSVGNNLFFTGAGIVIDGGSAAIINNRLVQFSNASTAGSAVITNNGDVSFVNTSTAGSAAITNSGTGSIGFYAASTAGSAAITNTGTGLVSFFNTSTAGTAVLANSNAGTFDFSSSTGPNNDNKLSAGSIAGGGNFYLGANQLTVGGNGQNTVVSGIISDCGGGPDCSNPGATGGSLVKTGTGTLTLSGINIYTGATAVNGGVLEVDGSIASSSGVAVNSGATLMGSGTVGATTVNSGGTLAPGNGTPGTSLAIAGSLALQSGAIYLVQVNPSTASFVSVTGTATLGGATVNAMFASGSYISKQYSILTAGAVSGTFGALVNTNLPANFHDSLSYDGTHAYLDLALSFGIPGQLTGNQQAVGNALTNFFNTTGGIPMTYAALSSAQLSQASGELGAGAQQTTFQAMGQFMGLLTDPFTNRTGGANATPGATGYADEELGYAKKREAYAMFTKAPLAKAYDPRWSVWAAGYGGSQSTTGNAVAGTNDTSSSIYGTAVGVDYLFSPNTIAGFSLAGGGTNFSVAGSGSGHSDLLQAGAYVRHTEGAAYISAALAYGWQDITTNRTLTIAGLDQLRSEFNANAYSGRVEGGYRYVAPWIGGIGITPYAAGQFTTFDLPAYAESVVTGSPAFALNYGAKSVTDARSELGVRSDKSFAMANGILTLRGRLAWAHDFDPDRSIGATFQALPGASFVVNGAAQASDSALTTASAEMKWTNGWAAAATFEGEFSNVTRSYAGKGVVRYVW
ncbi:MAG: autotransporter domain-containing protein [Bradyrhizobium sp.]|nr:autotransporter domain-containing protein [Bradyrhizobium sp.]